MFFLCICFSCHLRAAHIPESEDGGSLLGSSRKSLADTSVTSTADLSVFSGGQRSQQAFDICIDDSQSVLSEGADGEDDGSPEWVFVCSYSYESYNILNPLHFRSAFCSLNLMGRTPSTMRITPTPRAISPQDIVRIYVPAAPPDEVAITSISTVDHRSPTGSRELKTNRSPVSSPNSVQIVNGGTKSSPSNSGATTISLGERSREGNRNSTGAMENRSIIFGSGDITPVRQRFDDELLQSFGEASLTSNISNSGPRSTSSSRRGSLSRKSPSTMFESGLMECTHMAKRRLSSASNSDSKYRIGSSENISSPVSVGSGMRPTVSTISIKSNASDTEKNMERKRIMTSFEQLAARQRHESENQRPQLDELKQQRAAHHNNHSSSDIDGIDKLSPDDDENYSYAYYSLDKSPNMVTISKTRTKYVSESNIQYKAFSSSIDSNFDSEAAKRRPISSANETTTFQYNHSFGLPEPMSGMTATPTAARATAATTTAISTATKEYKRFYGTSVDEDEDNEEEPKKSSDESSSSPNSKSILNTPVNETIPLLSSPITAVPLNSRSHPYGEGSNQHRNQQSPSRIPMQHPVNAPLSPVRSPPTPATAYVIDIQPSPESAAQQSPTQRPSRIPLLHGSTSRSGHSSTMQQSPNNDLNRVLPPIEITQRHMKLVTSPTTAHRYVVDTRIATGHKLSQQNNGSTGSNANDLNTIRIKVNQNQRN